MRTRTTLAVAAATVLSAGAALAGVAIAADETDTVKAPYAQAAVSVNGDGTVTKKTKTIDSVRRTSLGRYCITLTPEVDAARSVPVATLTTDFGHILVLANATSACGANSLWVITGASNTYADKAFNVVVP